MVSTKRMAQHPPDSSCYRKSRYYNMTLRFTFPNGLVTLHRRRGTWIP
jgi:hypothetical protein